MKSYEKREGVLCVVLCLSPVPQRTHRSSRTPRPIERPPDAPAGNIRPKGGGGVQGDYCGWVKCVFNGAVF